jgi:predicted nucleic acid-binding protein
VIVVDSSAWIEWLRSTGSAVHRTLGSLVLDGAPLYLSEVVAMELLAGARDDAEEDRLRRGPLGLPLLPLAGVADFEAAAGLYRTCRGAGETVRSLIDCLVAVPTIAAGAELLHADEDFEILARHTPLRLFPLVE